MFFFVTVIVSLYILIYLFVLWYCVNIVVCNCTATLTVGGCILTDAAVRIAVDNACRYDL